MYRLLIICFYIPPCRVGLFKAAQHHDITKRESYWRILLYLMVPRSHHHHMRPSSHIQSIIDLNVINLCLTAVLYELFSLGITLSLQLTAQIWVTEFDVLECVKLLFQCLFSLLSTFIQQLPNPLSIKDTEAGCSAQLRTRWQALGRGILHRSQTLHREGCFRRFWCRTSGLVHGLCPRLCLSYTCLPSSLWVLVSNSLSQRSALGTYLSFPMPFPQNHAIPTSISFFLDFYLLTYLSCLLLPRGNSMRSELQSLCGSMLCPHQRIMSECVHLTGPGEMT